MNRFLRFFPIISLAMLFALWYLISIIVGSDFLFPSPSAVFADLGEFFLSEDFFPSLFGSLYRIALSFFAALILAFLFAIRFVVALDAYDEPYIYLPYLVQFVYKPDGRFVCRFVSAFIFGFFGRAFRRGRKTAGRPDRM